MKSDNTKIFTSHTWSRLWYKSVNKLKSNLSSSNLNLVNASQQKRQGVGGFPFHDLAQGEKIMPHKTYCSSSTSPPSTIQSMVIKFHQYFFKSIAPTKVNPVQEACTKCFAVHILKFEICWLYLRIKYFYLNSSFNAFYGW